MEVKLLQQEEEFHRYNAQLELKTSALMKEMEKVMTSQENFMMSPKVNLNLEKAQFKSENGYRECDFGQEDCNSKCGKWFRGLGATNGRSESLHSLRTYRELEIAVDSPRETAYSDFVDANKKSSTSDNIIRILNAKIKILQSEINSLRSDYKKKEDECKKYQNSIKQLEEEKKKTLSQIGSLKEENNQCQATANDIASKLHLKFSENVSLKKEVENLKKELKSMTQGLKHNEVRMNRALEEIDKLKTALHESNLHEKELRKSAKCNADHLTSVVRKLEKQKLEILHAFRKQVQLIENIKSQKELQQAYLMVELAEKNFSELLDSVPSLNNSHHTLKP